MKLVGSCPCGQQFELLLEGVEPPQEVPPDSPIVLYDGSQWDPVSGVEIVQDKAEGED